MVKYDRQKAVRYAREWWNKRNPRFYNFDDLGGDCTSFISQCLFHGGIEMNYDRYGWFYSSLFFRAPAWSGVEEFYSFSITNNSKKGVKIRVAERSEMEIGDVIQLDQKGGRFNHTLLVSKIINGDILVTCHSGDAFDKSLSEYQFLRIRYLKIIE